MPQELDIVALLTRPGTYVLGVAIFIVTFFMRRVIEGINPSLKKQADANAKAVTYLTTYARWWNEVVLYALPVMIGMISAWMKSDFFFAGLDDRGAKVLFGAVVGWFASFLYKLLRKVIKQKLGLDIVPDPGELPGVFPLAQGFHGLGQDLGMGEDIVVDDLLHRLAVAAGQPRRRTGNMAGFPEPHCPAAGQCHRQAGEHHCCATEGAGSIFCHGGSAYLRLRWCSIAALACIAIS